MKDKKYLSPFKCLCVTIGNLPTAYIESMSYYEALTYFMKFLENTVIPAINSNTEAITELQKAYDLLKEYVDNYFEDLDVQTEINNKLDELVSDGTLTSIISSYITPYTDKIVAKSDGNLEYMFTHHTNLSGFQALCCDNEYYYYYNGENHNLYKRRLSTNELLDTINITDFGHGNDMAIIDNKIYNANYTDKNIKVYDLSDDSISTLTCLSSYAGMNNISCITKYDDEHLLVALNPDALGVYTTRINDLVLVKVDITNDTYDDLTLSNADNLDLANTTIIQAMEYNDGNLYFLTSQPTMITQFNEINSTTFKAVNIYSYGQNDIIGLPYGEAEGIALLPDTYNGKGTFLIYTQMGMWDNQNKNLKFYCFNPFIKLPLTAIPVYEQITSPLTYTICYVKSNSSNYFECGTSSYPFNNLFDAIWCLNNSKYLKYQRVNIASNGNYDLGNLRNSKAIITMEDGLSGVNINGTINMADCDFRLSGNDTYRINLNIDSGYAESCNITLTNVALDSTSVSSLNFLNDNITIDKCEFTLDGLITFQGTRANLNFRSLSTSRLDGKIFTIDRNNLVAICNPDTIVPASCINQGYSVVIRYNNVTFS